MTLHVHPHFDLRDCKHPHTAVVIKPTGEAYKRCTHCQQQVGPSFDAEKPGDWLR